jgi:histidinol-phosphate aminotransferase
MASTASASRVSVAPSVRTARRGAARRVAAQAANSSYVRKHILDLAPYTPIVPFEILSGACQLRDRAASRAVLAFPIARGAHSILFAPLTHPPSTSPSAEQLGRAPEDIVKLDANENPYGPPPGASPSSLPHRSTAPFASIRTYPRSRSTSRPRAAAGNARVTAKARHRVPNVSRLSISGLTPPTRVVSSRREKLCFFVN